MRNWLHGEGANNCLSSCSIMSDSCSGVFTCSFSVKLHFNENSGFHIGFSKRGGNHLCPFDKTTSGHASAHSANDCSQHYYDVHEVTNYR